MATRPLFSRGPSEEEQRDKLIAQAQGISNPAAFSGFLTGAGAGGLFANAITQAFGAADPQQQRKRLVDSIRDQFATGELELEDLPDAFRRAGLPDEALEMTQRVNAIRAQGIDIRRGEAGIRTAEAQATLAEEQARPESIAQERRLQDIQERRSTADAKIAEFTADTAPERFQLDKKKLQIQMGQLTLQSKALLDAQDAQLTDRIDRYEDDLVQEVGRAGYAERADAYEVIEANVGSLQGVQNPNISDLELVTALAKLLDPTSVVRGSEVQAIQGASGISESLKTSFASALGGGSLSPSQRRQILTISRRRMRIANGQIERIKKGQGARIRKSERNSGAILSALEGRIPRVQVPGGDLPSGEVPARFRRSAGTAGEEAGRAAERAGQTLREGAGGFLRGFLGGEGTQRGNQIREEIGRTGRRTTR